MIIISVSNDGITVLLTEHEVNALSKIENIPKSIRQEFITGHFPENGYRRYYQDRIVTLAKQMKKAYDQFVHSRDMLSKWELWRLDHPNLK